jgi:hypothetical protein
VAQILRAAAPQRVSFTYPEQRGIDTAIGLDEAGINDDRDMLQEMRMVLRAPGSGDGGRGRPKPGPGPAQATVGGAATTPYGSHIGTLAVRQGRRSRGVDWDKLAYPYLDPETPVLDAVLQRAKTDGVDFVMVAGEVVYEGGRFTRIDRDAALRELHTSLQLVLPRMRPSAASCRRRCCPMSSASTPAISIPKRMRPITGQARGSEASNHARGINAADTSPSSP